MEKLISKFRKNATEEVVIKFTQFKGHDLLDLRVYYFRDSDEEGESKPSKKGLSISTNLLPELLKGLLKAANEMDLDPSEYALDEEDDEQLIPDDMNAPPPKEEE